MSRIRRLATRVLVTAVAFSAFGALSAPAAHADSLCAGARASVAGTGAGLVPCVPTPWGTFIQADPSQEVGPVWVQVVVSVPSPI